MPAMKQPAQPSMAVAMQRAKAQALRDGNIPNDVGLLPDTIIMPFGKNKPSWFSNYKDRLRLEKKRLAMRFTEFGRYAPIQATLSSTITKLC